MVASDEQKAAHDALVDDENDRVIREATAAGIEIMQFFSYRHLPHHLRPTSRMFANLACSVFQSLPNNTERGIALRKLLEAKDAGVRSALVS